MMLEIANGGHRPEQTHLRRMYGSSSHSMHIKELVDPTRMIIVHGRGKHAMQKPPVDHDHIMECLSAAVPMNRTTLRGSMIGV